jgi:hypothetical protein
MGAAKSAGPSGYKDKRIIIKPLDVVKITIVVEGQHLERKMTVVGVDQGKGRRG